MNRRALLCAGGALAVGAVATALIAAPKERVIKVEVKKFEFTPSKIRIKKGETVILELTTLDVVMGFSAPDLGVRADIIPGKVSTLRVTGDKVGEFAFICDVFCGSGHEDMSGTLVVSR